MFKKFQKSLDDEAISESLVNSLASFVCNAHVPKSIYISNIPELRWDLFCKAMAESEKLPPTVGTLKQHVYRAHIRARTRGHAIYAQETTLEPVGHGYFKNTN